MQDITRSHKSIKQALRIRKVEEKFCNFSEGKLNGTVHTCVGQEFSAIAFAGQIKKKDLFFKPPMPWPLSCIYRRCAGLTGRIAGKSFRYEWRNWEQPAFV